MTEEKEKSGKGFNDWVLAEARDRTSEHLSRAFLDQTQNQSKKKDQEK